MHNMGRCAADCVLKTCKKKKQTHGSSAAGRLSLSTQQGPEEHDVVVSVIDIAGNNVNGHIAVCIVVHVCELKCNFLLLLCVSYDLGSALQTGLCAWLNVR